MSSANDIWKMAIEAAGGEIWQKPRFLHLSGEARFTPYASHSDVLDFDTYKMYRVFPEENDAARKANGKVRFDAAEGKEDFFKLCFDGKESNLYLSEKAKPHAEHFKWSNNFGFSIFRFADREDFHIERMADDRADGYACYVLKIRDARQTDTYFWLDKEKGYIRQLGFDTEKGWHHRIYSNFERTKSGFLQPERLCIYFSGLKWMDIYWQHYEINVPIADEIFTLRERQDGT
ncbi:MAG: hypothetical protein AAF696_01675 [Bacteroidota bacterium]